MTNPKMPELPDPVGVVTHWTFAFGEALEPACTLGQTRDHGQACWDAANEDALARIKELEEWRRTVSEGLGFDCAEGIEWPASEIISDATRLYTLQEADKKELEAKLAEAERDARRYRWLCEVGQHRQIAGSASMHVGRGPFVSMELPCVYPPAGTVGFNSKVEIDAVIDAAIGSEGGDD